MATVWSVRVGPYNNPNEAYPYFSLPFCRFSDIKILQQKEQTKGAAETTFGPTPAAVALTINNKSSDGYLSMLGNSHAWEHFVQLPPIDEIYLLHNNNEMYERKYECTIQALSDSEAVQFTRAIKNNWFYELNVEDLPIWGLVGQPLSNSNNFIRDHNHHSNTDQDKDINSSSVVDYHLHTKRTLSIGYSNTYTPQDQTTVGNDGGHSIVKVDFHADHLSLQPVKPGQSYTFELSVEWKLLNDSAENDQYSFEKRFDRYMDYEFFDKSARESSVMNSLVIAFSMVLALLYSIRRIVKQSNKDNNNDIKRSTTGMATPLLQNTTPTTRVIDEGNSKTTITTPMMKSTVSSLSGLKLSTSDVFAPPSHTHLLAALVGNGIQISVLVFGMTLWFLCWPSRMNDAESSLRGQRLASFIYGYVVTSIISGYSSGYYFEQQQQLLSGRTKSSCLEDTNTSALSQKKDNQPASWALAATVFLLPTNAVVIASLIQLAASKQIGMISPFPFQVVLRVLSLWIGGSVPLNVVGFLFGQRRAVVHGASWNNTNSNNSLLVSMLSAHPPKQHAFWKSLSKRCFNSKLCNRQLLGFCIPYIVFSVIFLEQVIFMRSFWDYQIYIFRWYTVVVLLASVVVVTGLAALIPLMTVEHIRDQHEQHPQLVDSKIAAICSSWQWDVFKMFSFTGAFTFLYDVYYWMFLAHMTGTYQATYYFGTMLFVSILVALAYGSVAHVVAYNSARWLCVDVKAA